MTSRLRTRLLTPFVLAVAALVAGGVAATPASAEGAPTATGDNVNYVSNSGCYTSRISVTGLDSTLENGSEIYVYTPDSEIVTSDSVYDQTDYAFTAELCQGYDPVGTYSIEVDGTYAGSFSVAQPYLTLKRYSKRKVGSQLRLRGHAFGKRRVYFQARIAGDWYDIGSVRTKADGRISIYCKKHHRCPQLIRSSYQDFVHSRTFHVYKGPRNGRSTFVTAPASVRSGLTLTTR